MDVVTTSLEALIQRATNPLNEKPDIAAIEAFCVMLGKESKGVHVASRLLATHIQSTGEKEALQALTLLDTCMKRCGRTFHTEVGKFRFLNVMIKLVSPKYLGSKTPPAVRQKILDLLYAWTKDYPRESKIKETYEMLKKQGVVKEQASPVANIVEDAAKPAKPKNPIFEDEETTKVLQELLQSKDPLDLKLANKLIKSMVKDDEKRVQLNSQISMELQSVHNNVKLLSEMLDSYVPGKSSAEEIELMKELFDACDRIKPTVTRLANESQDNDEMLGEVLAANDELTQVFEKYASTILLNRRVERVSSVASRNPPSSLLDLFSPNEIINAACSNLNKKNAELLTEKPKTDMEMLGDIFSSLGNSLEASSSNPDTGLLMPDTMIMQPVSVAPTIVKPIKVADTSGDTAKLDSKVKAMEELNQLGESLMKESLSQNNSIVKTNFNNSSKPMKDIVMPDSSATSLTNVSHSLTNSSLLVSDSVRDFSLKNIVGLSENGIVEQSSKTTINDDNKVDLADFGDLLNDDDAMLDASPAPSQIVDNRLHVGEKNNFVTDIVSSSTTSADVEIKPLTDINVTIDSIKPGTIPPLTVIEEKNRISVVLHFPKGSPREDVTVIVVTTMSNNPKALSNYLFQAVVPKNCKCRLQTPSGTELPGHNPFLPPSAITQIMLIANPQKNPLSLKFMLSYTMDDETFTEMGEVDSLPTA